MLQLVDRFEGRAWLEWWANSSTCLANVEVAVVIDAIHGGWDASGRVVNEADLEGFKFLYDLDPVFQLRFEDGSTAMVFVHFTGPDGLLRLSEYDGPPERVVQATLDL
jgi:hypothetical protein